MTNDIKRIDAGAASPSPQPIRDAFYCGFLNPQGRLIAPAFLYPNETVQSGSDTAPPPPASSVLVDCHTGNREGLLAFIKRFKLRSKVAIAEVDPAEQRVWTLWADTREELDEVVEKITSEGSTQSLAVFRDARTPSIGLRVVVTGDVASDAAPPASLANLSSPPSPHAYDSHRITQGVPDGPAELTENHSLPLEANLDFMGGVDFRKGCYVGQELTARTHHTGVVRKRVMPVRVRAVDSESGSSSTPPAVGADLRAPPAPGSASKRSKSAGKLIAIAQQASTSSSGEFPALASLRLAHVAKEGAQLHMSDEGGKEWVLEPVWPTWWPEGVREEFADGGGESGE